MSLRGDRLMSGGWRRQSKTPTRGCRTWSAKLGALLLDQVADLDEKTAGLEHELRERAREDEQAVRLMSIPGIGPLTAMAIQAFAPPMESFRRGRDFSAWLGLVPRQHSTGGKPKLGKISKMGQRDLRRLLVVGAMATIGWAVRRGTKDPRAGPDAGAQTTHAGRGGAGQPHGAHRLGADDEERILPRAGRHRLNRRSRFVTVGNASRSEDGKGKRSTRRGRENQTILAAARVPDVRPRTRAVSVFGGVAARQGGRLRRGRGPVGTAADAAALCVSTGALSGSARRRLCVPALFNFLGAQPRLDYVVAMASNAVLLRHAEPAMLVARARNHLSEQTEHLSMDTDLCGGHVERLAAGSSSRPKSYVSGTASRGTTRASW